MYTFKLKGKIYPEELVISANNIEIKLTIPDFDIDGVTLININDSDIDVAYKTNKNYSEASPSEIETLKNYIDDIVRMIVDAAGFSQSYFYDIYILNFSNDIGFNYKFYSRGEYNLNNDSETVTKKVLEILSKLGSRSANTPLMLVLADFRMGMKYPKMTAHFCFRAIETIRKNFFEDFTIEDDKKRREDGWARMNIKFILERDSYIEIEKFALPNRHGDYPTITYNERENVMNFTRSIIDKLIDIL